MTSLPPTPPQPPYASAVDTVALLGGAAAYGLLCLLAPSKMATTLKQIPGDWLGLVPGQWFGALLAATVGVVLWGVGQRDLTGLLVERAGRIGVVGISVAFLIWTLTAVGSRAFGLGIFLGPVLMFPAGWRIWQISRFQRQQVKGVE